MTAILFGGGLDSTALAYLMAERGLQPSLVHVDYGQKAARWERAALSLVSSDLGLTALTVDVKLPSFEASIMSGSAHVARDQVTAKLDGRNLLLLGACFAPLAARGCERLFLGFHEEPANTPMLDALPQFVSAANSFLNFAVSSPLRVSAPLAHVARNETILAAAHVSAHVLDYAHTCYEDVSGGCGVCSHCQQLAALRRMTPSFSHKVHVALSNLDASCVA